MSDTYVECLVKAKGSPLLRFLKVLLIVLTVLFFMVGFALPPLFLPGFLLAVAAGVGAYFVRLHADLEYEYLYLDRELVIDKVLAKTKRKRIATYSVDRMEIFAPIKSYHLDNFRNRSVKEKDYSVGEELKPDLRYCMYYEGGEKLILNPSEAMVKALKNVAPRKVFSD